MKKNSKLATATMGLAFIATLTACQDKEGVVRFGHDSFPSSMLLTGDTLQLPIDDTCIPGAVRVADKGYMVYLYNADCFLAYTDADFTSATKLAVRGHGDGEVAGVSGAFGQAVGDDALMSVFDPTSCKVYGWNTTSGNKLKDVLTLPEGMVKYAPLSVLRMKSGKYIATRGDFQYGIVCYDPATGTTTEWPLGVVEAYREHPDNNHVSLRDMSYCESQGVIAEIYGGFPTAILHDESGEVIKTLTFDGFHAEAQQDEQADCFKSVCLTDNYIWLLYKGSENTERKDDYDHVFVLKHNGKPVADFQIPPTSTMEIDPQRRLILTADPNDDVAPLRRYQIPESVIPEC